MKVKYDFGGYATRNDLLCSDGVTIRRDAFKDNDGKRVPLVWSHNHDDPENVLGHGILENREDGVYVYGKFNDTERGLHAKSLVQNGDIDSLSIWANKLKKSGSDVLHGDILEVSLVLAGANPGAMIDAPILEHGEESETEACIYTGEVLDSEEGETDIEHSEETKESKDKQDSSDKKEEKMKKEEIKHEDTSKDSDKTVEEVFNSMTDEQKAVLYMMVDAALEEENNDESKEDDDEVKHNAFDESTKDNENVISHAEIEAAIKDAKKHGSMKESFIAHGIDNIDYLFPDPKTLNNPPAFIKRDTGWVAKVMSKVHKSPFSRIRSIFANITADEARAKGYTKGNRKTEEVFTLLKRKTGPTTIYKKQAFDRDDIVDITDFDVIAWIRSEMRIMLDEEIARAILIGDGRSSASDDKIDETHIRPIWTDDDLYTIKAQFALAATDTSDDKAKKFINTAIRKRKLYKGSGSPDLYITEDMLCDILLLEDLNGRTIYETVDSVARKLRVNEIIEVPVFENQTREDKGVTYTLEGIIVNLADYNVGADKGGEVNMFDDFDIDYNKQKYLMETRCSGALTVPYSAIALESYAASSSTSEDSNS